MIAISSKVRRENTTMWQVFQNSIIVFPRKIFYLLLNLSLICYLLLASFLLCTADTA